MKDYRIRSRDKLQEECQKLLKDLYVSCLDRAEKILKPNKRDAEWRQFRFEILNLGNDKIRQLNEKLLDYEIQFRPQIVFGVKYISDSEQEDLSDRISKFDFYFLEDGQPGLRIQLPKTDKNEELLKKIWESIRSGVVVKPTEQSWVFYEVCGLYEVFDKVIPFFDSNQCFKGKTLENYNNWKEQVYKSESEGVGDA